MWSQTWETMRRFRFRLEKLLAIRRYVEREWELRLGRATSAVIATRAGIAEAQDGIARSYGEGSAASIGAAMDAGLVIWAERYRQGMHARIASLEERLAAEVAELEKVRLGYLEASRKRKVLDKLKERQGEEVRRQQNRDEIAVLNEIATSRAVPWGEAGVSKP